MGSAPCAETLADSDPLRKDEVEDREVVGCEVPEDVHVGLHEAEVDPDGVDVLDVADLAAVDEPSHLANHGRVHERVVAHEHQPPGLGLAGQAHAVRGGRRQWLLHQHVAPGLHGL